MSEQEQEQEKKKPYMVELSMTVVSTATLDANTIDLSECEGDTIEEKIDDYLINKGGCTDQLGCRWREDMIDSSIIHLE